VSAAALLPFICILSIFGQSTKAKPVEKAFKSAGLAAFDREMARQRSGFCPSAQTTAAINDCYGKELVTTNENYSEYTRSLGQMLRINPGWRTSASHGYREFERAEAAWRAYREQTCTAIELHNDGGSGAPTDHLACALSLTGAHLQELSNTYSRVWRQ
jgi:uncharacterized protein YecT (DUF1311 family)